MAGTGAGTGGGKGTEGGDEGALLLGADGFVACCEWCCCLRGVCEDDTGFLTSKKGLSEDGVAGPMPCETGAEPATAAAPLLDD